MNQPMRSRLRFSWLCALLVPSLTAMEPPAENASGAATTALTKCAIGYHDDDTEAGDETFGIGGR
jgi:hypothetical protein